METQGTLVYRYTVYRWHGQTKSDLAIIIPINPDATGAPSGGSEERVTRMEAQEQAYQRLSEDLLERVPYTGVPFRIRPKAAERTE